MSGLRYGIVILPDRPWQQARQLWCRAEEMGFDHAWTYDHLMWRWLRDEPWFGCVPTLAAAAAATSRIRLGTLVASPAFRHPVTFAKELMALDDISDGRIVCGVGSGAGGFDEEALGEGTLTPGERVSRFADFLELTDRLLRERETTYSGSHYSAHEVRMHPGCRRSPRMPLAVAATGPRAMRLAARYADTWITAGVPGRFDAPRYDEAVPAVKEQLGALDAACEEAGRDPATLGRLLVTGAAVGGVLDSAEAFEDAAGTFEGLGFTDMVVHWPREAFPYEGSTRVLEEIAESLPAPGRRTGAAPKSPSAHGGSHA